jgi:hypothetical protein
MVLSDQEAVVTLPTNQARIDLTQGLESQLLPEGSGGFLLAMHLWRRFSLAGPDRYGDVYYLGTAPLPGRADLCDVLVATHDVVEARFYFDPMTGQLLAMEMYPDTNVDPCEVFFHDYVEVEGRPMPHRLIVQFGDDRFAELQIQQISFSPASENGA